MTPERRAEIERDYPPHPMFFGTAEWERGRNAVRDLLTALREAEAELRRCCAEMGTDPETWPCAAQQVRSMMCTVDELKAETKALCNQMIALGTRQNMQQRRDDTVCQTLGKALGYPRYCDDQKNFPGATEADGVCIGDHVAESLAEEAARKIGNLQSLVNYYALKGIFGVGS